MLFQTTKPSASGERPSKQRSLAKTLGKKIVLIFFLSILLMLCFNLFFTRNLLLNSTRTMLNGQIDYYEDVVDKWIAVRMEHLNILKSQIEAMPADLRTQEVILPMLTNSTQYGMELGVISDYLVYPNNTILSGDGWVADPDYIPTQKDYYTIPVQSGQSYLSSPYIDTSTKKFILTISMPLHVDGQLYGVLARDLYIDEIQAIASHNQEESSYLYLLDNQGNVLTHQNPAYNPTPDRVWNIAQLGESSFLGSRSTDSTLRRYTDYDGAQRYFVEKVNATTGWVLGLAYPVRIIQRQLISQFLLSLLVAAAALMLSLFPLRLFLQQRLSPIQQVVTAAQNIADGQLQVSCPVDSHDEIGQLSKTFDCTASYLQDIIGELSRILSQIAAGDLDIRPQCQYRGEFRQIHTSILHITDTLNHVISGIRTAADQVAFNARQLSDDAQRLAHSTQEQDLRFGPLVDGCDQLSQVVAHNTERCRTASRITAEVLDRLDDSNRQMGEMTEAMNRINTSSHQISSINQTIEDIAFQTNILALNAAVEAARAGTAGKGFAVVADEVRNLAAKSSQAAQNTTRLIDHSVHMVDSGTGISHATAQSLRQAVDISRQVSRLVQEIVTTSEMQTSELQLIVNGIREIANLTVEDSNTARQNAAASQKLTAQAQALQELAAHFRTR